MFYAGSWFYYHVHALTLKYHFYIYPASINKVYSNILVGAQTKYIFGKTKQIKSLFIKYDEFNYCNVIIP